MDNCCLTSPITVFVLANGIGAAVVVVEVVVEGTITDAFRLIVCTKGTCKLVLLAEQLNDLIPSNVVSFK
jgi:hypothetical protein